MNANHSAIKINIAYCSVPKLYKRKRVLSKRLFEHIWCRQARKYIYFQLLKTCVIAQITSHIVHTSGNKNLLFKDFLIRSQNFEPKSSRGHLKQQGKTFKHCWKSTSRFKLYILNWTTRAARKLSKLKMACSKVSYWSSPNEPQFWPSRNTW